MNIQLDVFPKFTIERRNIVKRMIQLATVSAAIFVAQIGLAQAPAGAPAGSTAQCNDGTYFSGAAKSGACSGHKGVKKWWGPAAPAKSAAPAAASTKPASPAPAPAAAPAKPAPAATPAAAKPSTSTMAAAAGGAPNLVWLNTGSNVYHCYGSTYYGKTKAGAYMSEADAKAKGGKPNGGKPCSK
jgi:hypothetical protein